MKQFRTILLPILFVLGVLLTACQSVAEQPSSVARISAETAENEEAKEQFLQVVMEHENAFQAGDVDRLVGYYAENAISMPPGFPASTGRSAIEADLRYLFDEFTLERDFTLVEYEITGDKATRRGEWTQTLTPKEGGDPIVETGRCVLGFTKVDGEWKVDWEIWNTYETVAVD